MKSIAILFLILSGLHVNAQIEFEEPIISTTLPVAVALHSVDINNDSFYDVLTYNSLNAMVNFNLGDGAGNFDFNQSVLMDHSGLAWCNGIFTLDLNGDPWPDLVAVNSVDSNAFVLQSNGNLSYEVVDTLWQFAEPGNVITLDLNSDGWNEILISDFVGSDTRISIFTNSGSGQFELTDEILLPFGSQLDMLSCDTNNDGNPDVIVSGGSFFFLLISTGDGTLSPTISSPISFSGLDIAAGDLNEDDIVDLVGTFNGQGAGIFWGEADGSFGNLTYLQQENIDILPRYVLVEDFDLDGFKDIIIAALDLSNNGNSSALLVYPGNGTQDFGFPVTYTVSFTPDYWCGIQDICSSDVDNDSDLDLIVTTSCTYGEFSDQYSSDIRVYLNLTNQVQVEEEVLHSGYSVYPNPAKDAAIVKFNQAVSGEIKVLNAIGTTVFVQNLNGCLQYELDTSSFSPGTYIIQISDQDKVLATLQSFVE